MIRLRKTVAGYRRMPVRERHLVRVAASLLLCTRVALAFAGVATWSRHMHRIAGRCGLRRAPGTDRQVAERTSKIVANVAERLSAEPSCLHRSLVLEAVLRAQGMEAQTRYGVRRGAAGFEAHAWVEHEGVAITAPGDPYQGYAPLDSRS